MNRDAAIGIIDSGVGGLTVARAVIDQLPNESIRYIGDTANGPYGPLPISDVREHALTLLDELADQGVKLLVIACNTASAAMFRDAKERYTERRGIPVVEVIQPAVRTAVQRTRSKKIGVIGTVGTIKSGAYQDSFVADPEIKVTSVACPRFVEFVEAGVTSGAELFDVANEYLQPLKDASVDTLVLGCTHYPMLSAAIQYVMGPSVTLVSSAEATAFEVYQTLLTHDLLRTTTTPPTHSFETTGDDTERFRTLAHRFLGLEVGHVESFPTGAITLPTLDTED
ncbi:MAG: glutamate racemase [Microbacteriaceae bacterium]